MQTKVRKVEKKKRTVNTGKDCSTHVVKGPNTKRENHDLYDNLKKTHETKTRNIPTIGEI